MFNFYSGLGEDILTDGEYDEITSLLQDGEEDILTDGEYDEIISLLQDGDGDILTDGEYDEVISLLQDEDEDILTDGCETKDFLFSDAGRVYFLWVKKLKGTALRKKYVQDASTRKTEDAEELAVDFLIECAQKNKFRGFCEERRFGYICSTIFSQWNTRRREKLGKQAGVRGADDRFKTQTDKLKGEALTLPYSHSIVQEGDTTDEKTAQEIVYDPQQTSVEDQVVLNQMLQIFEGVIRYNCEGDAKKYRLWKELGRSFIEYHLHNRRLYESDTSFSEQIGISLSELRKNKNALKKALASSRELREFL